MADYSDSKELRITDVGAGGLRLDRAQSPWLLEPRQWQDALNVTFVKGGVERVRGFTQLGSNIPDVSVANDNLPIAAYGYIYNNTGANPFLTWPIVVAAKRTYKGVDAGNNTLTWTSIQAADYGSLITSSEVAFEVYRGNLYIAAPPESIRKWDGLAATAAVLAGAPAGGGTDIFAYNDRLVLGRLGLAGSIRNQFQYSDQGLDTSWPASSVLNAERTSPATMRIRRSGEYVYVYKYGSIEMILTTANVVPFYVATLVDGIGLSQPRAVTGFEGAEYFVSQRTVHRLRDRTIEDIGLPVARELCRSLLSGSSTAEADNVVAGVLAHQDPDYDEIVFSTNIIDASGARVSYTFSPRWETWSKRDFGQVLQFASPYLALGTSITQSGAASSGTSGPPARPLSMVCSVVNPKSIYRTTDTATVPAGFSAKSSAKSAWLDGRGVVPDPLEVKRWKACMMFFERGTATMTLNFRTYNEPNDVRPAAVVGQNLYTTTVKLDGTKTLFIPINLNGRWMEVEIINNTNGEAWRLSELCFIVARTGTWH